MTLKQHAEAHAKACREAITAGKPHPPYKGPSLCEADLEGAYLYRANLRGANLRGANLYEANLGEASLDGAIMPDGRTFEAYKLDPLAGICGEPEARERAIAAWGKHTWDDCPMHEAYGWKGIGDAPEDKRLLVAAFVALFDAELLPKPEVG